MKKFKSDAKVILIGRILRTAKSILKHNGFQDAQDYILELIEDQILPPQDILYVARHIGVLS
jgi:hypothetical protein